MDFKQVLKEQIENVAPTEKISEIEKSANELSQGMSDYFSFDNIVNSTLKGESFMNSPDFVSDLKGLLYYEIKCSMILGIEILLICIVTGLLSELSSSLERNSVAKVSSMVCAFVIAGLTLNGFNTAYILCMDSVSSMVSTMEILAPVLLGILIATGSISSGTVMSPMIIGAVTGTGIILKKIILPLLFGSSILTILNCLTEKNYVKKLSKLMRNAAVIATGLIVTVLSGIISVQGLITEASDGLLINTAKYSLSTFIPIVGGFTSDTAELFIKCMSSIKSLTGVFGIVMLLLMILIPLIKIMLIALIYKLTAAAAETISGASVSDGLNDAGSCLTAMGSVLFFTALLFIIFISIIVGIKGG